MTVPPAWLAELGRQTGARPVEFLEAALVDAGGAPAPIRVWTGVGTRTWNGVAWTGIGDLVEIDPIPSAGDGEPASVRLAFVATDALLQSISTARTHGRTLRVWLGWLTDNGSLIDPVLTAYFLLDEISVEDDRERPLVRVTCVDALADLDRPRLRRLSPESQQSRDPSDRGLEYVANISRMQISVAGGYLRREARRAG